MRARLDMLQRRYREAGMGVLVFHAAAAEGDGITHLALGNRDRKDPWEDLGASAIQTAAGVGGYQAAVPVRSIDLGRIIHILHHHLKLQNSKTGRMGKMLMKLDVEGLEFSILPALVRSQTFCLVDAMRVEWHTRYWTARVAARTARRRNLSSPLEVGGKAMAVMTDAIRTHIRELIPSADCKLELIQDDDETYMHDRKPWPMERICTAL
ncbi:MAG: hypothetical protein SGPRY_009087 [Prymnesium sp.]